MTGETFGHTRDGQAIHRRRIAAGGLYANVLTYGAIIQDLRLAGHEAPLVLGFEAFKHYLDHSPYFGAVVGRFANRIAAGRFIIDGERYQAEQNDNGNTLHGGAGRLDRKAWEVRDSGADFIALGIVDPPGEMGFPGTLDIVCTYRIRPPATLSVELTAKTDRPTLCSLAQHSYFNLDDGGRGDILSHRICLAAQAYLPTDDAKLPIGAVLPVQDTEFDFVLPRTIRHESSGFVDYDHNFCLSAERETLRQVAWVQGDRSGVEMELWTTEPGVQFFSGGFPDRLVPGLDNICYRKHAGFCLEPQIWPDAPNRPYFPQALLRPGETYRQMSEFRFRMPGNF